MKAQRFALFGFLSIVLALLQNASAQTAQSRSAEATSMDQSSQVAQYQPFEITLQSARDYTATADSVENSTYIDPFDYRANRTWAELSYCENQSTTCNPAETSGWTPAVWGNGSFKKFFGFWDGGTTWRYRLSFPKKGLWKYVIRNSFNDAALQDISGTVNVIQPLTDLPLRKHGHPLMYSKPNARLEYADGTPFYWLADTLWLFPKGMERLIPNPDTRPGQPALTPFIDVFASIRRNLGFTVVQTHGWNYSVPVGGKMTNGLLAIQDRTGANLPYWADFDKHLRSLHDNGMIVMLGYGSFDYFDSSDKWRCYDWRAKTTSYDRACFERSIKELFFYSLARHGAYPVNYLVTQEFNQYCDPSNRPLPADTLLNRTRIIREIGADVLKKYDPYQRARALHFATYGNSNVTCEAAPQGPVEVYTASEEPRPATGADPNLEHPNSTSSWVDFFILQQGHRQKLSRVTTSLYDRFYSSSHNTKPFMKRFVEGEFNWEGFASGYERTESGSCVQDANGVCIRKNLWLPRERWTPVPPQDFVVAGAIVQETAATSLQSGALGFSYGSTGLFNSIEELDEATNGSSWGPIETMEGAIARFRGPFFLSNLKLAYRQVDWWKLRPLTGRLSPESQNTEVSGYGGSQESYVLHLRSGSRSSDPGYLIVDSKNTTYLVEGFSPRSSNRWASLRSTVSTNDFKLSLPKPSASKTADNFLLVVRKKTS